MTNELTPKQRDWISRNFRAFNCDGDYTGFINWLHANTTEDKPKVSDKNCWWFHDEMGWMSGCGWLFPLLPAPAWDNCPKCGKFIILGQPKKVENQTEDDPCGCIGGCRLSTSHGYKEPYWKELPEGTYCEVQNAAKENK